MTELTNNGIITSYEYDANGNLTKKELDTGVVTNYTYNKAGLLTELVSKNGSDEYTYSECTYLLNGLLSGVSMPYDGNNSSESKIKHYSYDGAGRLKTESVANAAGVPIANSYEYDLRGNRIKKIGGEPDNLITETTVYEYDLNNRLMSEDIEDYDETNKTYENYSVRYYYDANGNTTAKQTTKQAVGNKVESDMKLSGRAEDCGLEVYRYDNFNRLTNYNSGDTEAVYTYNANNLRASKAVNRAYTSFVWNGQNLASETTNGSVDTYTYDATGVYIANFDGDVHTYLKDNHQNVIGTVDSTGEISETENEYDAFGNVLSEGVPNPFGYCGEYYDSESGLIYLRNRYYDTASGRFITEDPAKDGSNWYSYCGGNPVMAVDPSGLKITASVEDSSTILKQLQALTDDELAFEEEFDENGVSTGMGNFVIKKSYDTDRHVGQKLVSDLINSSENVLVTIGSVEETNDDGSTETKSWLMYCATDTEPIQIYINPGDSLELGVRGTTVQRSDGTFATEDIPDFIHFGHELSHAWRDINGLFVSSSEEVGLIPYDSPQLWREEELQTMGINYTVNGIDVRNYSTYNGIISENGLRLENNLNTRVSYYYAY